jgi:hypothetical protein
MPAKSIIDIEIDTTTFDSFKASYAEYEKTLNKTPEAWAAVTKEAGRTAEEFLALVTAATAGVALATELAEAEKATAKELDLQKHAVTGQAKSWHDMAKDSRSFAFPAALVYHNGRNIGHHWRRRAFRDRTSGHIRRRLPAPRGRHRNDDRRA